MISDDDKPRDGIGKFASQITANRHNKHDEFNYDYSDAPSEDYLKEYKRSIEEPEQFWSDVGSELVWSKPWDKVLDNSNPPFTKWYVGGELSVCHNALDRHVEGGGGSDIALIHDSPLTSTIKRITYEQLQKQVSLLAGALRELGVSRGHRVLIYMPLVPEAVVSMLATIRIGAVHSVVFGGFAARELRVRIEHAEPTVIVAASCGIEPNKIVRYKEILDEALSQSSHKPRHCIVLQRRHILESKLISPRDIDWDDAVDSARPAECVPMEANEPLYILYTSGTTAAPKGVVRSCGGHAAALLYSMRAVYNIKQPTVWWAASDLGWVVGHSYICYAPLLAGVTSVLYEGKPDRTPDPGQYFRIIDQHRVDTLFTIPTVFRVLRRADPNAHYARRYDSSSLRAVFVAGELCDHNAKSWGQRVFNKPILNHWWQTESGSPITAPCRGLNTQSEPNKSAGYPVPGYNLCVLREDGTECARGEEGRLVAKLPLPPGFAATLWGADQMFNDIYFSKHKGYYDTQDEGWMDSQGAVYVSSRADDVINVAGHRLSTGALEDVVMRHPRVADCLVCGAPDHTKGDVPLCLFVMRPPLDGEELIEESRVVNELIEMVRTLVGPIASFNRATAVGALPRTRSGKAMRAAVSQLARGVPLSRLNTTSASEDPTVFREIQMALQRIGYALDIPES